MAVGEPGPPSHEDPLLGQVVSDRYRILRKLGEGGMGAVYLAEHVAIEKKVALKVLAPELARRTDLSARFLQEARSASRIGHENVIDISDFGQSASGHVFFAMEYLQGADLGDTIRTGGPLPWSRARGIVLQICRALRAAHQQGIVHRDLKPENIFLVQREGRGDFVKLLDFGIAKVMNLAGDAPRLTRAGMIFGTPEYMAPEQAEGKDTDHRVDIYAVGCVLYHVVTGVTPFQSDSFMGLLTKHILEDPVRPSARRPDLPIGPQLDAIVMRAMEKDREHRFRDMDELIGAIEATGDLEAASSEPARGSSTRQLGGAAAMPVVRSVPRASATELVVPDTHSMDLESPPARARRWAPKLAMVAGIGLLAVAGAAVYLTKRPRPMATVPPEAPAPSPSPTASVPAAPEAPAPPPTAAAAIPAASEPAPTTTSDPPAPEAERGRTRPRARREPHGREARPGAPAEAPSTKPAPPPELKPFPTL